MHQVASKLRLELAQYRELVTFTQFGTELDKTTQDQLTRGERMVEVLKQLQYQPLPVSKQTMIIFAGSNGFLDDLKTSSVKRFERELYCYVEKNHGQIQKEIEERKELTQELTDRLYHVIAEFKASFKENP
ncbi:MAG TPA: F0F1 ATP synthase subunit alpha, partial [Candidatus Omnitrophota bacterium]|nr:F0F1 ATP synthase subunit alpha [Candidatus Omnitrophota bacterium]